MTFDEAIALAQRIDEHYPRLTIVAIGRFVPPAEIRPELPWAITVLVDDSERATVIREPDQLIMFASAERPPRTKRTTPRRKQQQPEPAAGMLF